MSGEADSMLVRLNVLPARLRVLHLAALLRCAAEGSPRAVRLTHLLSAQSAETSAVHGGRAG
jgi:hypothetical protein